MSMTTTRNLIKAHLKKLSKEDRYSRFGAITGDDTIDRYVDSIPPTDTVLLLPDENGDLIGFVHISFDWPNKTAEIGMSVLDEERGQGYGTELLDQAIHISKAKGAKTVNLVYGSDNVAMYKMISNLGFRTIVTREQSTGSLDLAAVPQSFAGNIYYGSLAEANEVLTLGLYISSRISNIKLFLKKV